MNMVDIVSEEGSSVRKAVLVASLVGREGNARLAALYDLALEVAGGSGGDLLKHAHGSVFVLFEATRATEAIALGAALLAKASEAGVACAVALSYGSLAHFETASRGVDYLGEPLERALWLGRAGNAGALLVDEAITVAAAMGQLEANLGGKEDFVGDKLEVRGDAGSVACFELRWADERFGLRVARDEARGDDSGRGRWVTGVISSLGSKFGFIVDRAGTPHYFQSRNLAFAAELRRGSRVVFRALPPLRGAKEKRAEDVFVMDALIEGVVTRVNAAGWGFVKLNCENGLEHNLFTLGLGRGLVAGQRVRCRVGVNDQGPVGYRPEVADAAPEVAATEADETTAASELAAPVAAPRRRASKAVEAVAAD